MTTKVDPRAVRVNRYSKLIAKCFLVVKAPNDLNFDPLKGVPRKWLKTTHVCLICCQIFANLCAESTKKREFRLVTGALVLEK